MSSKEFINFYIIEHWYVYIIFNYVLFIILEINEFVDKIKIKDYTVGELIKIIFVISVSSLLGPLMTIFITLYFIFSKDSPFKQWISKLDIILWKNK